MTAGRLLEHLAQLDEDELRLPVEPADTAMGEFVVLGDRIIVDLGVQALDDFVEPLDPPFHLDE